MLTGANLHLVGLAQVAEGHTVLRMSRVGALDRDRRHVVGVALSNLRHFIKRFAFRGRRGSNVIQRNGAGQAALVVFALRVVFDLFARDHLANFHARLLRELHSLLASQLVARVVQREQQHAMAFIGKLHSLEDRSAVRCGKDVAVNLDIEHAGADKALLRRLVAGAAVRDDGHAVCVSKRTAHDRVAIDRKDIAIRQPKADKLFVGDGLLAVDELLHRHVLLAFSGKSPYFRGGRRHRGTPPSCPSLLPRTNEEGSVTFSRSYDARRGCVQSILKMREGD